MKVEKKAYLNKNEINNLLKALKSYSNVLNLTNATTNNKYEEQALDFCRKYGVIIKAKKGVRPDKTFGGLDYYVTILRNDKQWAFWFTDSIANKENNKIPTAYDVLACLEKYEVADSLHDFCHEFGYNEFDDCTGKEDKESRRIWKAVQKEYNNVVRMFSDCLEELCEIR